jgi:predicted small metal-binding protein
MGKIIDCSKVNPVSGCFHVVRGATGEEFLRNAGHHAKEHGIMHGAPELLEHIKANMENEQRISRPVPPPP